MSESVAVLGASPHKSRYSNMAIESLLASGHKVIPVNPNYNQIESLDCYPDLDACPVSVDTVTVYLNPGHLLPLTDQLINLNPYRVIFNPGSETPEVEQKLSDAGIRVQRACTLVLLNMKHF